MKMKLLHLPPGPIQTLHPNVRFCAEEEVLQVVAVLCKQNSARWQCYSISSAACRRQGTLSQPGDQIQRARYFRHESISGLGNTGRTVRWTKLKHYWLPCDDNLSILLPEWVRIPRQATHIISCKRRIRRMDLTWALRGWKTHLLLKKPI